MKSFARLYTELDATTSTQARVAALVAYFRDAPAADAAWAAYFLAGGKPRQVVRTGELRRIALAESGLSDWLFEECYQAVGDLAETIAHVLPDPEATNATRADDAAGLAAWVERLAALRGLEPAEIETRLRAAWNELDWQGRFLSVKLIGGGFRVGVSKLLVTRALAEVAGLDAKLVAQRMMGWTDGKTAPTAERYAALLAPAGQGGALEAGQPYPFFLAHPLVGAPDSLGGLDDWMAEWKYDGIRAQIGRRGEGVWIWSRGEELITERFPEIEAAARALPAGTVLDGELLAWKEESPLPFALLQQRIGRKTLTKKVLQDAPAAFVAYDLLEQDGADLRTQPQHERRARLEAVMGATTHDRLRLSPLVQAPDWSALAALREQSRARGVEGLMLKRRDSGYGTGRTRDSGEWWKWKIDPYSVDAVLVYAQRGHGRRASLYTDFTFAVWDDSTDSRRLVPFAKAYSGLTDAEFREIDAVIRATTVEKFGPVRSVTPTQVFELGFEGIQRSPRHKSGVAVRFPRMLRWRRDKKIEDADTLASLLALIDDRAQR